MIIYQLPDFGIWEWFLLLWVERDPTLALQKMSWKKSDDPTFKKNTSNFGKWIDKSDNSQIRWSVRNVPQFASWKKTFTILFSTSQSFSGLLQGMVKALACSALPWLTGYSWGWKPSWIEYGEIVTTISWDTYIYIYIHVYIYIPYNYVNI